MIIFSNKNHIPSPSGYIQEYTDIFLEKAVGVLPAYTDHNHAIKLAPGSNPLYKPIYNL